MTDRAAFEPCATAAALLLEFHATDPGRFAWRQPPYEYEHEKLPIDILAGSPALRTHIEAQVPLPEIQASWQEASRPFLEQRQRYLLY